MKLVFLLMVFIGPSPGNPDGKMVDSSGQYFADIRKCNGYAESIEQGKTYSRRSRGEPQYRISAWCEPRKVRNEVEVIW